MNEFTHFKPELLSFIRELVNNNNRPWFEANKPRYKQDVQTPMLQFIEAMGPRVRSISEHFTAIPKVQGGSLFRIYRDVRFSKDKSPYKTRVAAHFRHQLGKSAHAPGFYFHVTPTEVAMGGGIWLADKEPLLKMRECLVDNPNAWTQLKQNPAFMDMFGGIWGEQLKRPPRGFDADHPHIEDIKRKSFFAVRTEPAEFVLRDDFLDQISTTYQTMSPLMSYIAYALEVPY